MRKKARAQAEDRSAPTPAVGAGDGPPDLAVIVPTLNEKDNIEPLLARLGEALAGIAWEAVFVDDDSQDGTGALLLHLQSTRPNVRVIRRIGRRGLSSACIEGMLATGAPFLAVIDADLQHDETILPRMLETLRARDLDVVVGSRFSDGGGAGALSSGRLLLSRFGRLLSRAVSHADLSDPMSGYFVLRRSFFEETVRRLSGQGFKILLDLFASAPRSVRFAEVPFTFRPRHSGRSKLDTLVMLEYVTLLSDKLLGPYFPTRFVMFVLVGLFGVVVHLSVLGLAHKIMLLPFYSSQIIATFSAMTINFNLNNLLTYRDRRLSGIHLVYGHLSFYLICSIGALANFQIAEMLFERRVPWMIAGFLGAMISSVWNYGVSSTITWKRHTRPDA
ncbi:MAG TPA: glycosyltransferase family 2 protein [Geminicoccaceae bacterium]|nr:glycosyltransferase family 2 protein [Geminicoccaceae bacterium]